MLGQRGSCGPGRLPSARCPTLLPDRALCARRSAHAHSPSTLVIRSEPTPESWERSNRAIRRSPRPLTGEDGSEGKMPLTDLCNRPTARAPERPLDSRFSNACDALDAGGGPVDAEPPASGGLATLPRDEARTEEHRTGAALRCVGVFGRAQRSKPNPLTPPVPLLRLRTDVAVPPSRGTPSPARGAFHRLVSPSLHAHRRKPATSPAALPPRGRLPAPRHLQRRWESRFRISFRLRLNDWTRESIQGSSPRCRAGLAPPVDF